VRLPLARRGQPRPAAAVGSGYSNQLTGEMNPPDPASLKLGDVLLYPARDLIGDIIAISTHGIWSHVEVVSGPNESIAARIQGVNYYPRDNSFRCVRRFNFPSGEYFDILAAKAALQDQIGKPYDIPGLFSFFDPWAKTKHVHRICSVIANKFLVAGGATPFDPLADPNLISPTDFWITGGLTTIWKG
jgi:hypothetical protein